MTGERTERDRIVDAASRMFYERGIHAVGMDAIRAEARVSLKRLYAEFGSKDELLATVLRCRSEQWDADLASATESATTPREKLLAVYDFLGEWFRTSDFRGCAFINAFGELSGESSSVAAAARIQKEGFQRYVGRLVDELGAPAELAEQLAILAEGAQTTSAISGNPSAAARARDAAEVLIDSALSPRAA